MKVYIRKRGAKRGRYYSGRSLNDIVRKFRISNPNLSHIRTASYQDRIEIITIDLKSGRWAIYEIPKFKITK